MEAQEWVADIGLFPSLTPKVREAVRSLVSAFGLEGDAYAGEKLAKSFSEPLHLLASTRLRQVEIEPAQLGQLVARWGQERVQAELARIERELEGHLARQHRHFATFLSAVGRRSTATADVGAVQPPAVRVQWTRQDVLDRRPNWTEEQAEAWLMANSSLIEQRVTAFGNQVLRDWLDATD